LIIISNILNVAGGEFNVKTEVKRGFIPGNYTTS
jgi:hypothetical protein